MTGYIERAFERADAAVKPDPGRMTAHRLNRSEYTNTIRDLLGVRFRAERDFPADDSADGFDNIGDVLTVSPLLMERYLSAAERIAGWALATEQPAGQAPRDWLPRPRAANPPPRSQHDRSRTPRRIRRRVHRPLRPSGRTSGGRGGRRRAREARILDGRHAARQVRRSKRSRPALCTSIRIRRKRFASYLPEGDHVFRAGFMDDPFMKTLPAEDAYNRTKNKFLDAIIFVGPFPSTTEKDTRKKILDLQSGVRACVRGDDRRPILRAAPIAGRPRAPRLTLCSVSWTSQKPAASPPSRGCSSPSRRCSCLRISSSASSAIPIRAIPRSCTRCRRSSWRRGSAISCGAPCPMRS